MLVTINGMARWAVEGSITSKELLCAERKANSGKLEKLLRNDYEWFVIIGIGGCLLSSGVSVLLIALVSEWFTLSFIAGFALLFTCMFLDLGGRKPFSALSSRLENRREKYQLKDDPRLYQVFGGVLGELTATINLHSETYMGIREMQELLKRHSYLVDSFLTDSKVKQAYAIATSDEWLNESSTLARKGLAIAVDAHAKRVLEAEAAYQEQQAAERSEHAALEASETARADHERKLRASGERVAVEQLLADIRDEYDADSA